MVVKAYSAVLPSPTSTYLVWHTNWEKVLAIGSSVGQDCVCCWSGCGGFLRRYKILKTTKYLTFRMRNPTHLSV